MWPLLVVFCPPQVQISLQCLQRTVELLTESDVVEFIFDCAVEALADAICLRTVRLGPRMVQILNSQIELIGMVLDLAALFCTSVGQDTQ